MICWTKLNTNKITVKTMIQINDSLSVKESPNDNKDIAISPASQAPRGHQQQKLRNIKKKQLPREDPLFGREFSTFPEEVILIHVLNNQDNRNKQIYQSNKNK